MPIVILAVAAVALLYLMGSRKAAASASSPDASIPDGIYPNSPDSVQGYGSSNDAMDTFTNAIATFEGFFNNSGNTIAQRYNNPGNLTGNWGDGIVGHGTRNITRYGDSGDGWGALSNYVTAHASNNPGWDFYDFFNWYLRGSTTASPVDNQGNSDQYAEYVAGQMGVDPTTPVAQALGIGS
jgi:hypothetical protein